jgi:hypothetical protein
MNVRSVAIASLALLALTVTACESRAPGASASGTPPAISYDDFSSALCSSFTSLIRAVGNPDAGTPSVMSKALDDAVARGDALAADQAAAAMLAELEAGRAQAAVAGRWAPGAAAMRHMDALLVAFEASTNAKRAVAAKVPGVDPQKAFEAAGGVTAWSGMLGGIGTLPIPPGASPQPCRAFSGQL